MDKLFDLFGLFLLREIVLIRKRRLWCFPDREIQTAAAQQHLPFPTFHFPFGSFPFDDRPIPAKFPEMFRYKMPMCWQPL